MTKSLYGVTSDTKTENVIPFRPTEEQPITLGFLKSVSVEDREIQKGDDAGTTKKVLVFRFESQDASRLFSHTEWDFTNRDEQHHGWLADNLNSRIGHIYTQYAKLPETGIGANASSFEEFIEAVSTAFNNLKDMAATPIWIKVAYSLKRPQDGLTFPQKPNFVEKAEKGKPTKLFINKQYETITQPQAIDATAGLAEQNSGEGSKDFPTF